MSPGKHTTHSGTNTYSPTKHTVESTGNINFPSDKTGDSKLFYYHFHLFIPVHVNSGYKRNRFIH